MIFILLFTASHLLSKSFSKWPNTAQDTLLPQTTGFSKVKILWQAGGTKSTKIADNCAKTK